MTIREGTITATYTVANIPWNEGPSRLLHDARLAFVYGVPTVVHDYAGRWKVTDVQHTDTTVLDRKPVSFDLTFTVEYMESELTGTTGLTRTPSVQRFVFYRDAVKDRLLKELQRLTRPNIAAGR